MVFTLKGIFYQHIDWSPKYFYDPNKKVQIRWYLKCQREFTWTESILLLAYTSNHLMELS
ncbi:hypothetical protein WALSEDRAFT_59624 [Wallemia mellicola CBS 633.66]|uniref:Uncharacterized protein n=1 Tax=Wallemia mellicola (strain ATCC MYA-4683 / CBS 633.66) TaxID=671144 RepID=I4YHM2_WALMC|nr:hypothetical protein WALSEDRAFT_59624 [Wallemia mellicola CBS 633.66]EIM23464.1 hypothetical protein WALSEDRAFT_59624 [Wallemia mellicola CBS 633.66]|eukprot:XP_006956835.1 hypothetical protein WALSEDRAFT_59624 [Wallemia mellicola CBS 633.66]